VEGGESHWLFTRCRRGVIGIAPDFPFVLAPNFPPPFHLPTVENWTLPVEHKTSPRRLSVHQDMGVISPAIQFVESTSPLQMGWRLGLIAGTVHHFVCQYPIQWDVLATLVVWMVSNLVFLIAAFFYTTSGGVLSSLPIFNGFYVTSSSRCTNCRFLSQFC
jgi:hypothetical protein